MLWWRRNEGFEWQEYVRTTVLLRRRQRRDKLQAAREAAADNLKEAGRKGLAAGAAGAEAAGQAAIRLARSAAGSAAEGAEHGLSLLARSGAAVRQRIATASAPLNARLTRPLARNVLAAAALIGGTALAVRASRFGFDFDAALLAAVAATGALLWSWPRLFPDGTTSIPARTRDTTHADLEADATADGSAGPTPVSGLAVAAVLLLTAGGLWLALPVVGGWLAGEHAQETTPRPTDPADTLTGTARIAAPGLLTIDGVRVRLADITLLAAAQTCRHEDGTTFACGRSAKQALEKLVRGRRQVVCTPSGEDDGARIATCSVDGKDLAADLVRGGHAFADGTLWARYAAEEADARAAKAGLWAGEAERPEAWQARVWNDAAAAAPGGCPIKGRIQSGRRIYLMPTAADYARTIVRETRSERWFCSVEEAEAAGFRPRDES